MRPPLRQYYLSGRIHTRDGRVHTLGRWFHITLDDVKGSALKELARRRDKGAPWYGDAVVVYAPTGRSIVVEVPWPYEPVQY